MGVEPVLLTDIAAVREHMQESTSDSLPDERITRLIVAVTDVIPRYCEREFIPTSKATRRFEFRPTDTGTGLFMSAQAAERVDACPYEMRAIEKVTIDPEVNGGTVLEATKYRLSGKTRDGTYYCLLLAAGLPTQPQQSRQFPTRQIDIEADWGMAAVPAGIKHLANETVESWLHLRRDRDISAGEMEGEGAPMRPSDLPPGVRWELQKAWKRPWLPR